MYGMSKCIPIIIKELGIWYLNTCTSFNNRHLEGYSNLSCQVAELLLNIDPFEMEGVVARGMDIINLG